ncbi:protein of unknown function [Candidatus Methylomirabilis oxygeniifera]|uniref:Uncharacterized protein n=1 Tax=Methylomirabilis oxygeniifera TaxID=671143 RepID=D5MGJ7_METO1|nr:protein of unknown function [Candidatus Methylomirabilis oxyfera]
MLVSAIAGPVPCRWPHVSLSGTPSSRSLQRAPRPKQSHRFRIVKYREIAALPSVARNNEPVSSPGPRQNFPTTQKYGRPEGN